MRDILLIALCVATAVLVVRARRIETKGDEMAATIRDVLDRVKKIRPAIDKFEARVTELLRNRLTPQEQADLDEATAELDAALGDAEDGIDEAAGEGGNNGEPTPA